MQLWLFIIPHRFVIAEWQNSSWDLNIHPPLRPLFCLSGRRSCFQERTLNCRGDPCMSCRTGSCTQRPSTSAWTGFPGTCISHQRLYKRGFMFLKNFRRDCGLSFLPNICNSIKRINKCDYIVTLITSIPALFFWCLSQGICTHLRTGADVENLIKMLSE